MIYVNSVNVCPKNISLKPGEWFCNACIEVCPAEADFKEVFWHSENPSIASVGSSNGYIYANSIGTTRIFATATDGSRHSDYITVTVSDTICVSSLTLNRLKISLEEGEKATLTARVYPENASNKNLKWTSSNNDVATVNNGVVTAVSKGFAVVTASAIDGSGESASCNVVVTKEKLVSSISISSDTRIMFVGKSAYFYAMVTEML